MSESATFIQIKSLEPGNPRLRQSKIGRQKVDNRNQMCRSTKGLAKIEVEIQTVIQTKRKRQYSESKTKGISGISRYRLTWTELKLFNSPMYKVSQSRRGTGSVRWELNYRENQHMRDNNIKGADRKRGPGIA